MSNKKHIEPMAAFMICLVSVVVGSGVTCGLWGSDDMPISIACGFATTFILMGSYLISYEVRNLNHKKKDTTESVEIETDTPCYQRFHCYFRDHTGEQRHLEVCGITCYTTVASNGTTTARIIVDQGWEHYISSVEELQATNISEEEWEEFKEKCLL